MCAYFKEQILEFLIDIFNFQKVRYTTVEELSDDIYKLMKERVSNINLKFQLWEKLWRKFLCTYAVG